MGDEGVGRLVSGDPVGSDVSFGLGLALLPPLGPEPLLVGAHRKVGVKLDDAVVTFDDLHLGAGPVESVAATHVGRQREQSTTL